MTEVAIPDFASIVDSEQMITRAIQLAVTEGDDRFDFTPTYRSGSFRPTRIKLFYRVNRGASSPYWYLFNIKITGGKVLSGGRRVSTADANVITESFYPERAPEWARAMGADLLPTVEIERGPAGV
ncbi:hypothetical protein SEA_LAZERLEMON_65 [Streptomyces phage LazerLemon]|nr:hypothetical protein SEA_LAZERLEMON_65 [Streptomyces phage LazerLemon]